jgi:cytochrome c5
MKLITKCLGLFVCTALPFAVSADVEDVQIDHHAQISGTSKDKPMASAETPKKNGEKNLVNEPLPRGQLLYENHCHACHESTVHIRKDHKAKNYADIQYWVGRWSKELDTKWSSEDIEAVAKYLNDTFYHY